MPRTKAAAESVMRGNANVTQNEISTTSYDNTLTVLQFLLEKLINTKNIEKALFVAEW